MIFVGAAAVNRKRCGHRNRNRDGSIVGLSFKDSNHESESSTGKWIRIFSNHESEYLDS